MLETARERAVSLATGTEFEVKIPDGYSHVHNMELLLTLTTRADEYGVRMVHQFNDTVTFRKL